MFPSLEIKTNTSVNRFDFDLSLKSNRKAKKKDYQNLLHFETHINADVEHIKFYLSNFMLLVFIVWAFPYIIVVFVVVFVALGA